MSYSFDEITPREGTNSYKYDARQKVFGTEKVIPLWIADSDFPVAPFIVEALRERVDHPVYGYTFRGEEFTDAVGGWVKRRNGWEIHPEWIGFSPGVVAGFSMAIQALTEPGEGVLIQPPVYPPFAKMTRMNNRQVVNNPLVWNGRKYVIDFEDLEAKLSRSKVFLMCNPHNPTSRVFTRKELTRIGELCVRLQVDIISDEIHSDLVFQPHRHIHIASLSEEIARRTVTFIAPSKTFNVAGLASSVAIIPNESLRRRFQHQLELVDAAGNIFGSVAIVAAYRQGDRWVDDFNGQLVRNAQYVTGFIRDRIPSVQAFMPESTYLMWLDFRQWNMEPEALFQYVVDHGLGLNSGITFGEEGRGFLRLNIATSLEVLQQAMYRLEKADRDRNSH
ncbi:MAG: PatB family C-S lyase [Rikenellaceae bacterium]|nr:PatB family C-S lyase [Rikenellaceae bacterium]